ncbi:malonyl CoA-acyl carrier protein transacylase [Acrocarpospora corrugata]|uniref:Malonyl CoA-acyl carrier protein transacylase n=1 Tax=Acrocarpospora corrugata TaxID=35763 RepID=A0A5M3VWV0_9ACTN|nr:ACP S-malonyltransferase [Acrocarpospora corrugata]GER99240.1 malonyl CoA-acyl carrier protein transacylase [Acrocarpospora corrugata]
MLGYLFPGQGTVRVGMGAWLRRRPVARAVLEEVDELLTRPISALCARGPLDRLVATEHAQIAVTACNLAALAVLAEEGYEPGVVAGHSVGELTALHAAGVLGRAEVVGLVETRSRLMSQVGVTGGMRAVMGLPVERVEELAALAGTSDEPLVVGLENAPGHVVVSGSLKALDRLTELAADASKIMSLAVGNAFHSPLMASAVPGWAEAVRAAPMRPPRVPVVPNVTGRPTTDLELIRDSLIAQLTGRVRWTETVAVVDGLALAVEVGDSKVLAGLSRRTGARCLSMADPGTLRRLARESAA